MPMLFDSYEAASDWYSTSDYKEMEWYDGFEEEQLIEFAYSSGSDYDGEDSLIAAFLREQGEEPEDYGL
ncbi:hypothetical protein MHM84_14790 [Halomonas sp. McH1-25]|uniref:hypothetical protein n=1 Tax=unclassified Halomonas TaxID=2609666 RepID=UPI001EF4C921|nr:MULTISPECIES: hypothetical protein [unclassified Halomonas]MCG7601047.1 hypothetical protein [Halomonas sp. McH1-25]MCP1344193.1 hypothetical protein [Halomonas sp. FL8]MCP1361211.1 hypothetical protein [Halomonas sp. BBD45]MCP1364063.1 hypothetical protein [Halomonas sp. BBD48]